VAWRRETTIGRRSVENAGLSVWQTVVAVADEIDASLIVCGARGRNGLKRAMLGSVAEAVRITAIARVDRARTDHPQFCFGIRRRWCRIVTRAYSRDSARL